MYVKSRSLIIVTLVSAAIFLIGLTGCTSGSVTQIELGMEYERIINIEDRSDPTDKSLRGHVYRLDVAAGDTYIIEVSSKSDTTLMVNEMKDKKSLIININGMGNWTVDRTFYISGEREIWVQAVKYELPAEYTLCITKAE